MNEIVKTLLITFLGSGLIVGMFIYYIRRYIDKALDKREKEENRKTEMKKRRRTVEDELWHSAGRLFFWINRFVETGEHNGELKSAYDNFESAEAKKKQLDRDIIAEHEGD